MVKKNLFIIAGIMSVAIIILICMVLIAPLPNQKKNGFTRKWLNDPVLQKQLKTGIPFEALCGTSEEYVFASTSDPRFLIRFDYAISKIDTIIIPVALSQAVLSNRHFDIYGPSAYLFLNNQPGFIYGELNDTTITTPTFTKTKQLFSQSTSISPSTAVIRTFDSLQKKQVLQKISGPSGHVLAEEELFEEQPNKGFSLDGMLKFDNTLNLLTYVQFYQNRFFTLDTNLIVRNQFNTIDTTFTNMTQITQAKIDGQEKLVPAKARITVNKTIFVDNGLLYIVSGLRADNETHKEFKNNTTLDVYQLYNGKYIGSLHIPDQGSLKMNSFLIRKDKLFALYKKNIVIYQLSMHHVAQSS